jgi:hypothetical protein
MIIKKTDLNDIKSWKTRDLLSGKIKFKDNPALLLKIKKEIRRRTRQG